MSTPKTAAVTYERGTAKLEGFGVKLRKRDLVEIICQLDEALDEARRDVPTNWCDPLLSGDDAALPGLGPWGCREIEALLRGIQDRMTTPKTPDEEQN